MVQVICDICGCDMTEHSLRRLDNNIGDKRYDFALAMAITSESYDICPNCQKRIKQTIKDLQGEHPNHKCREIKSIEINGCR